MPRNVSGTYSLPLPPVVPNTVIQAAWANTTEDDIAQALTDSLDRNGRGGMTAAFRLINGSVLQPAFAFSSETGTGVYLETPGVMAVAVMGAKVASWSGGQYTLYSDLSIAAGHSITSPINVVGNVGITGDVTLNGDVGVAGGLVVGGGITSLDDVTVDETFNGEAGFYATNHSGGVDSSAVFNAMNNTGQRMLVAATGSGYTGLPALSATGMLYSNASQGLALVTSDAAKVIRMMPAGGEAGRWTTNGLGIGTTPGTTGIHLDVVGTIRTQGGAGPAGSGVGVRLLNSAGTGGGSVTAPEDPAGGVILSGDGGPIQMLAGSSVPRMIVQGNGQVVVGVPGSPYVGGGVDKFTVWDGGITINSSYPGAGNTPSSRSVQAYAFNSFGSPVASAGMSVDYVRVSGDTDYGSILTFFTAADNASAERMRINRTGEVGIGGAVNPADLIKLGVLDAGKVPAMGFIRTGLQGWYVGGDKTGTTVRFDISANAGPILTLLPRTDGNYMGLGNVNPPDWLTVGSYADGLGLKEMSVFGPYGSAAYANVYVGLGDGNGGGKIELNGHTSATTLSSWRMIHHSDIAGQDLTFRFAASSATRPAAASYAERFRVSSTGVASVTSGGNQYIVATDPGGAVSGGSPPVGAIVHAVAAGAGFTAFTAGQAQALTGSITLTAAPIASGSNQVITSGVWRLLGASNTGTNTALWQRIG
jgi:hypothetical protein